MPTPGKGASPVSGKKGGSYSQAHACKANNSHAASTATARSAATSPAVASSTSDRKPTGSYGSPIKSSGYSARAAVHVHAHACTEVLHTSDMSANDHARLMAIMQADDLPKGQPLPTARKPGNLASMPAADAMPAPASLLPTSPPPKPHLKFTQHAPHDVPRTQSEDNKAANPGVTSTVQLLKQLLRSSTEGPAGFMQAASALHAEASTGSLPAAPATSATADGTMQSSVLSMLRGPNARSGPIVDGPMAKPMSADSAHVCNLLLSKSAVNFNRTAMPPSEEGLIASSVHTQRRYNRNAQSFAARASTRVRNACTMEQRKNLMASGSHLNISTGMGGAVGSVAAPDSQDSTSRHTLTTIITSQLNPSAGGAAAQHSNPQLQPAAVHSAAVSFSSQQASEGVTQPSSPALLPSQMSMLTHAPKDNIMSTQSFTTALYAVAEVISKDGPAAAVNSTGVTAGSSTQPSGVRRRRSRSRSRKSKGRKWWNLTCGLFRHCDAQQTMSRSSSEDSTGGASDVLASMALQQSSAVPPVVAASPLPAAEAVQAVQAPAAASIGGRLDDGTEGGKTMAHVDDPHDTVELHSPRISAVGGNTGDSADAAPASAGGSSSTPVSMGAADAVPDGTPAALQLPSVGELQNMELVNMLHTLQGMLLSPQPRSSNAAPPRYGPASSAATGSAQPSRDSTAGGAKPTPAGSAKVGSRRRSATKDAVLTGALHVTHAPGAVSKPTCHLNSPFFTFGVQKKATGTHVVDGKAFSLPAYLLHSPRLSTYQPPWQRSPDAAHYAKWAAGTANNKSAVLSPTGSPRGPQPSPAFASSSLLQSALQKRGSQQAAQGSTWRPGGSPSPRGAWWDMNAEGSPRRSVAMQSSVTSSVASLGGLSPRTKAQALSSGAPVAVVVPTSSAALPRSPVHGAAVAAVRVTQNSSKGGAEPAAQPSFNVMLWHTDGGSSEEMQTCRASRTASRNAVPVVSTRVSLMDLLHPSTATVAAVPLGRGEDDEVQAVGCSNSDVTPTGVMESEPLAQANSSPSSSQCCTPSRQGSELEQLHVGDDGSLETCKQDSGLEDKGLAKGTIAAAEAAAAEMGAAFSCDDVLAGQQSNSGQRSSAGGLLPASSSLKCDDLDLDLARPGEMVDRTSMAISNAGLAPPHDPQWTSSRGISGSGSSSTSLHSTPSKVGHAVKVTSGTSGVAVLVASPVQARTPSLKGTPASPLRTASRASSSHMLMAALDPLAAGIPIDATETWTPAALRHYEAALENVETILAQEQGTQKFC